MKIKLAALLAFALLVMAGCTAADTNTNTTNMANVANANKTSSTAPATSANENMVKASGDPTSTTGGTKEGCKCSAAGMVCNSKDGKGCCGGKDGTCSSMKDGKSECCAKEGEAGASCCSTAGKTASTGTTGTDNKAGAAAPAKKTD